jgi:hypothetical protein
MRWIVVLTLVALAFLAGRWTAPGTQPVRATRTSPSGSEAPPPRRGVSQPHRTEAPDSSADIQTPRTVPVDPAAAAEAPIVHGTGTGTLEVRGHDSGQGFNELELLGRDFRGEWDDIEWRMPEDSRPIRVTLAAGRYRLRARHETEPGERLYRIAIRPGVTEVVDLAQRPGPGIYALADGLGRVDVRVTDVRGDPIPDISVRLIASDDEVEFSSTPAGHVWFDVMPGRYGVAVGWMEQEVVVTEGRTSGITFDGRTTAEVEISGVLYAHAGLHALDHGDGWESIGVGRAVRHVLLRPGRYQIVCWVKPTGRRVLETLTVSAGERVRRAPAQQGVFVVVACPVVDTKSGRVFRRKVRLTDPEGRSCRIQSDAAALVDPGDYVATIEDKTWISDPVAFRASRGQVRVELPVRKR